MPVQASENLQKILFSYPYLALVYSEIISISNYNLETYTMIAIGNSIDVAFTLGILYVLYKDAIVTYIQNSDFTQYLTMISGEFLTYTNIFINNYDITLYNSEQMITFMDSGIYPNKIISFVENMHCIAVYNNILAAVSDDMLYIYNTSSYAHSSLLLNKSIAQENCNLSSCSARIIPNSNNLLLIYIQMSPCFQVYNFTMLGNIVEVSFTLNENSSIPVSEITIGTTLYAYSSLNQSKNYTVSVNYNLMVNAKLLYVNDSNIIAKGYCGIPGQIMLEGSVVGQDANYYINSRLGNVTNRITHTKLFTCNFKNLRFIDSINNLNLIIGASESVIYLCNTNDGTNFAYYNETLNFTSIKALFSETLMPGIRFITSAFMCINTTINWQYDIKILQMYEYILIL